MAALRPSNSVQLHDLGRLKPKVPITKERLIGTAFAKAEALALRHASKVYEAKGNHVEFRELEKRAFARIVAGLYARKQLFDGQRGFVSQNDAYSRVSLNKKTGRRGYYKGVDSALYGLFEAGMTTTQVSMVTHSLLFGFVDQIKHAEIDGVAPATTAAQFYAGRINPHLQKWAVDKAVMAKAKGNIIFILYLGMKRELGDRAMQRFKDKLRQQGESLEDRQLRIAFGREDVRNFLTKEPTIPLERVMDMLHGASTKVSPAFFESLKPAEREAEEVALTIPEIPGPQEEAVKVGWKGYVSAFFASVKRLFKAWFG